MASVASARPTLSLGLPNYGGFVEAAGARAVLDLGRAAEDAGVDRVIVVDHLVMSRNTDAYSWGRFPTPPEAPWLEPLTVLAAMSSVTSRVRLATGILIAPLRAAAVLAKTAATLDVLSGGRLDLGVGVGWQREEYAAVGLDFAARGRLLDEQLAACRALWSQHPTELHGTEVWCSPLPAQQGGPKVWVSGTLSAAVESRVVRFGDGWIPIMTATDDDVREGAARLRGAFAAAGRDPALLQVRATLPLLRGDGGALDLEAMADAVPRLAADGATDVHVAAQALSREPAELPDLLARLVRAVERATGMA